MSDDPAGVVATVCLTVCLELFGGFCLDFASTSKSSPGFHRSCPYYNSPLQLIHAPVVSAYANSTLAQKTRQKTKTKTKTRESGIPSYPSLKRRGEPLKPLSSKPNRCRVQPCPNLNLPHDPGLVHPSVSGILLYFSFQGIVIHLGGLWATTM